MLISSRYKRWYSVVRKRSVAREERLFSGAHRTDSWNEEADTRFVKIEAWQKGQPVENK